MRLSDREVAILRVLADSSDEVKRGMYPGRIARLAGFARAGRMDAGATRTLDSMSNKKLVRWSYEGLRSTGRRWWITDEGRDALGEYAFGE